MSTGFDNGMAWQRQPGHYEVWYLTLTHRASGTGFWIRYTLRSPQRDGHSTAGHLGQASHVSHVGGETPPYAQVWFSRGDSRDSSKTFGINRRFPIDALSVSDRPFSLRIGDNRLWRDGLTGALRGAGHDVSWDLRFLPVTRTHFHLPTPLYLQGGRAVPTVVFSPNLSIPLRGTITVDGERYECDGEPGGQTHLWGRKHAYAWAWAHCNAFDQGESPYAAVFEALTVQLRRGPVLLPKLTVASVYPDGLSGEEWSFRELWHLPRNRGDYRTGRYHLIGQATTTKIEATLTCRAEDMVRAEYVDPDGEPAYCHNTVVAGCELTLWRRRRGPGADWERYRTLGTAHGAHWEWGGRAGDSTVPHRHLTVNEA